MEPGIYDNNTQFLSVYSIFSGSSIYFINIIIQNVTLTFAC